MNDEGAMKKVLRDNWHLFSVLVLMLGAAIFFALRPSHSPEADAAMVGAEVGVELSGDDAGEVYSNEDRWAQPTKDARFEAGIEKYEHEVQFNRESPETPVNLFKLGNLYFGLGDYKNASKHHSTLLAEFPRYEGMRYVFRNLVVCYDKLGKTELKRSTLRQMMDYFGPETPEHQFAAMELGL